jgi:S-adenosylmethionine:tRNA ribosyltransferase-isomerase
MHLSDFDYELPDTLIATEPIRPRDASRMLVLDRHAGNFVDSTFRDLPGFLRSTDVLVLNDTRVIRARIRGELQRSTGTTRQIETLFNRPITGRVWEVMCKPGKRIRAGDRIVFPDGVIGTFGEIREHGLRVLELETVEPIENFLERHGEIPLPPYIARPETSTDAQDYQTVYSSCSGAIAAPTAGLHFTDSMLERLHQAGVEIVKITLHVGIGTFVPVRSQDPRDHVLQAERFQMTADAAHRLNAARTSGRRLIAVGTTTTRTLEHIVTSSGSFAATQGEAGLFIVPGYEFKVVAGLLTNFHLPKSTLLMLVSAFAGRERILNAYEHAVQNKYRFYSYGDCMLIL